MKLTVNDIPTMLQKQLTDRKARFRAALALAHMTAREFADRHGVTQGHLSQVLSGTHASETLVQKIEAFTAKHLKVAA